MQRSGGGRRFCLLASLHPPPAEPNRSSLRHACRLFNAMKKKSASHASNKVHFACFNCRVCFKQPDSSNWDASVADRPFECPNCKTAMVRLGRYFKAPPRRAVKQWMKVELLHKHGETFYAGNSQVGVKCDTISSTIAYLIECGHDESDVRTMLSHIQRLRRPSDRKSP